MDRAKAIRADDEIQFRYWGKFSPSDALELGTCAHRSPAAR